MSTPCCGICLISGGPGTTCAEFCPSVEACCMQTGCQDIAPNLCAGQGGISGGAGSSCFDPPEACCAEGFPCVDGPSVCCEIFGGAPAGAGSDCEDEDDPCAGLGDPIPTVSQWGMITMAALLLGIGGIMAAKRRAATA